MDGQAVEHAGGLAASPDPAALQRRAVGADGRDQRGQGRRRAAASLAAGQVRAAHPPCLALRVASRQLRDHQRDIRRGCGRDLQGVAPQPAEDIVPDRSHLRRRAERAVDTVQAARSRATQFLSEEVHNCNAGHRRGQIRTSSHLPQSALAPVSPSGPASQLGRVGSETE